MRLKVLKEEIASLIKSFEKGEKTMFCTYHDSRERICSLVRKNGCRNIEINDIKKAIEAIKILHRPSKIEVFASGGCIEVEPLNGGPSLDPVYLNGHKILEFKRDTFIFELKGLKGYENQPLKYKTKKINKNYTYQQIKKYYNVIDKVIIKYYID